MTVSFTFNAPAGRLSLNDRRHWANKARISRDWRTTTEVIARNHAILNKLALPLPPGRIDIGFVVGANRRRDRDNLAPTTKAIVDGLVDAGWWADDDQDTVESYGYFVLDKARDGQVRVTVTPWEQAA